ncbi:hypothetical protein [Caulobacter henricii]|uniref:DUF3016 domain-containing protein n=1 Tax=Caulobacter henricii TaxID=69395 RepID=A0A0P0P3K2_9CAUL|nr:hypothetical protein [Caulobacter henricii]ALL15041.1 hypothetical protein AQ619_17660 [Caulobacter henricii]
MKTLIAALVASLSLVGAPAVAAPQASVRTVTVDSGFQWGSGPSNDFATTLTDAVNDHLAECAVGKDLRLDLKVERLQLRRPEEPSLNPINRLVVRVKIREARSKTLVEQQKIKVEAEDNGGRLMELDPERVLSEATGDAICRTFFAG